MIPVQKANFGTKNILEELVPKLIANFGIKTNKDMIPKLKANFGIKINKDMIPKLKANFGIKTFKKQLIPEREAKSWTEDLLRMSEAWVKKVNIAMREDAVRTSFTMIDLSMSVKKKANFGMREFSMTAKEKVYFKMKEAFRMMSTINVETANFGMKCISVMEAQVLNGLPKKLVQRWIATTFSQQEANQMIKSASQVQPAVVTAAEAARLVLGIPVFIMMLIHGSTSSTSIESNNQWMLLMVVSHLTY